MTRSQVQSVCLLPEVSMEKYLSSYQNSAVATPKEIICTGVNFKRNFKDATRQNDIIAMYVYQKDLNYHFKKH